MAAVPERSPARLKLLLVGWDGADWRLVHPLLDAGRMPALGRLVDGGVMGELATLHPQVSPLLWTSLATGKRGDKHGILGFVEPVPGGVSPVDGRSRRSAAIWDVLSGSGRACHVVGWPTRPAEAISGVFVTHLLPLTRGTDNLPAGVVHPASRADVVAPLRVDPAELTHAHLLPFVPGAARIDQARDRRLAGLATMIADCSTVHATATWVMEHEAWDVVAVHYDLLDRASHVFMPYRAPAHGDVPVADCELYGDVVTAAYVFADMMLARLLDLAGDDTAVVVVSDHGFRSGRHRPRTGGRGRGAVNWHGEHGIVVMRAPGVRRDEWLLGAGLLDIAPTVLALLGLPVGADMDGRPLVQAFAEPPAIRTIPSWDAWPGVRSRPEPADDREARLELVRLVDQGYLVRDDLEGPEAGPRAADELRLTLARVHVEAGRLEEAEPLLRDLHARHPDVDVYTLELARCLQRLGAPEEGRRLVEAVIGRGTPPVETQRLLASLAFAEGRFEEALEHLFLAEQTEPDDARLHCQIGEVYVKMRRWNDAEGAFERALDVDEASARAHHGLAVTSLAQRRWRRAADAALTAVGLAHDVPLAHYHLGVALARLGEREAARLAFETYLLLRPGTSAARRWLARLQRRGTGAGEGAPSRAEAARAPDPAPSRAPGARPGSAG